MRWKMSTLPSKLIRGQTFNMQVLFNMDKSPYLGTGFGLPSLISDAAFVTDATYTPLFLGPHLKPVTGWLIASPNTFNDPWAPYRFSHLVVSHVCWYIKYVLLLPTSHSCPLPVVPEYTHNRKACQATLRSAMQNTNRLCDNTDCVAADKEGLLRGLFPVASIAPKTLINLKNLPLGVESILSSLKSQGFIAPSWPVEMSS